MLSKIIRDIDIISRETMEAVRLALHNRAIVWRYNITLTIVFACGTNVTVSALVA